MTNSLDFFLRSSSPPVAEESPLKRRAVSEETSEELLLTPPLDMEETEILVPINDADGEYEFLELRYPPISPRHDTVYIEPDLSMRSVHGPMSPFIEEIDIITKHAVKYLDCPPYSAALKVVGITRGGHYVVLQQAFRSCVPAAVSMIALDRGKTFLGKEITHPVTHHARELVYIRQAGFEPLVHLLGGSSDQKVKKLEKLLLTTGPGILHVEHPDLKGHACVLDDISWVRHYVTVRDPFNGRMLTVKLYPFASWIAEEFIQLK